MSDIENVKGKDFFDYEAEVWELWNTAVTKTNHPLQQLTNICQDIHNATNHAQLFAAQSELVEMLYGTPDQGHPYWREDEHECSFCKRDDAIEVPMKGSRATGSYWHYYTWERQHRVFNGYVCEFHANEVEWTKLNYREAIQQ